MLEIARHCHTSLKRARRRALNPHMLIQPWIQKSLYMRIQKMIYDQGCEWLRRGLEIARKWPTIVGHFWVTFIWRASDPRPCFSSMFFDFQCFHWFSLIFNWNFNASKWFSLICIGFQWFQWLWMVFAAKMVEGWNKWVLLAGILYNFVFLRMPGAGKMIQARNRDWIVIGSWLDLAHYESWLVLHFSRSRRYEKRLARTPL